MNDTDPLPTSEPPVTTAPPAPAAWKAWAFLGTIGAGLALAVGRYVFLPMPPSPEDWKEAILAGTVVALAMTGWRGWRAARSAQGGVRRSPAGLALAVFPALAVLVGLWAVSRIMSAVTLEPVELPGIDATLPSWTVRSRVAASINGRYSVEEPGQSGFITLGWGPEMEKGELLGLFQTSPASLGGRDELGAVLASVRREAAMVGGHEAETLEADTASTHARVLITTRNCPEDHRTLWLTTMLHRPVPELRALHQRMLAGMRCHTGKAEKRLATLRFDPPPGMVRTDHPTDQVFTGPPGGVNLSPGTPGRKFYDDMQREELRRRVISGGLQLPDVKLREAQGTGDGERHYWTGSATEEGERMLLTLLTVYCASADASYVAIHLGPATGPEGLGVALLSRVECP